MHPYKGFFECIKRRRVQHFLLDLGAEKHSKALVPADAASSVPIRAPGHQEEFLLLAGLCGPLALVLILKVVQSVSEISSQQYPFLSMEEMS